MSVTCTTSGAWDAIKGNRNLSEQQWQSAFLFVLCEMKAAFNGGSMSNCTVAGVWDAISGTTRFKSDQEFYAESLKMLCDVATMIGGGGGGSGVGILFTSGVGLPATDGSILTQGYRDITNPNQPAKYINTAWPNSSNPTWEAI